MFRGSMRAAVIGLVVAGVSGFLVWSYMRRFEDEASGGPRVAVLTVNRTLEPGAIIKDADMAERAIPQAYVDSRAIRASERQRISNLRVSTPIDAQQILIWSDIVSTNDERVMSNLVQPNMRAVMVHTEGKSSAMVRPGDRVDVIATLPQPGTTEQRAGVVLLQNVLVLGRLAAAGHTQGDAADVALSLSLQNSQVLAVAGDKAKLSLALRAPDDVRVQEGLGEFSSTNLAEPAARPVAAPKKSGPINMGGKQ
jgi:pilus assembly protein CpaB